MKDLFSKDVSNWRLIFIVLTFIAVGISIMKEELGLTYVQTRYIKYAIYAFLILGYADIPWKKIRIKRQQSDILDKPD